MKILFWGTPTYAINTLDALVEAGYELVGVVSQPDRRRSRGKELLFSPVKIRALELGLKVFTPQNISKETNIQAQLANLGADIYIVVAFGQILPAEILAQPPGGCWNGHGSLLPRWRGAAPIEWSLAECDKQTGVGIMAMEAGLDTGPILIEESIDIVLTENAEGLAQRLSHLTAKLFLEALPLIAITRKNLQPERFKQLSLRDQARKGITYAHMLSKQDFIITWSRSALAIHLQVMGFYPRTFTTWNGKRLKVLNTEPLIPNLIDQLSQEAAQMLEQIKENYKIISMRKFKPGEILFISENIGLVVATADYPVLIKKAQLQDRQPAEGQALIQQITGVQGETIGKHFI
uniref:Methionyl-tRNA formyltransferase, mitochondrial n=1 Tax=Paulinella longichromatophora TaxID=1708747 RepID=A0A2H4ZQ64_9EUKA|nr:methionyl-tRNA formyltransferase [Paulinella longichromatophora]